MICTSRYYFNHLHTFLTIILLAKKIKIKQRDRNGMDTHAATVHLNEHGRDNLPLLFYCILLLSKAGKEKTVFQLYLFRLKTKTDKCPDSSPQIIAASPRQLHGILPALWAMFPNPCGLCLR